MGYLIVISLYVIVCTVLVCIRVNRLELRKTTIPHSCEIPKVVNNYGRYACFLLWLILFLLTALRGACVGNDTHAYLDSFRLMSMQKHISIYGSKEIGYQLFELLISYVSDRNQAIIIASTMVIYILYAIYINRHSDNSWFMMALFFATTFSRGTNTIRQTIAQVILLFAYQELYNSKYLKAFVITLVASLFHRVALAFILFIFTTKYMFNGKKFAVFTGILFVISLSGRVLIPVLRRILPIYAGYFTEDRIGDGWLAVTFSIMSSVIYIVAYILGTYKEERNNTTKWLFGYTITFQILGYSLNIFPRVAALYSFVLLCPMCNEILESSKRRASVILLLCIIFALSSFLFTCWIRPNWNVLIPYRFFF